MTLPALTRTSDQFPGSAADAAVLVIPDISDSIESLSQHPGLAASLKGIGFTGSPSAFTRVYAPEVTELPFAVVGGARDARSVDAVRATTEALEAVRSLAP